MKHFLENITEEELKEIIIDEIKTMIEEDSGILSNIFKFCRIINVLQNLEKQMVER